MKNLLGIFKGKQPNQDKKEQTKLPRSTSLPETPNTSFTSERPQLKKLPSIRESKPNSNKANQKVLNRVLQPLDNFPLHGLKFSGKDDSEEETIYKKELRELRELKEIAIDSQNFKELLVFKLSGISEILRNPQLTPENTQTQQNTRTPRKSMLFRANIQDNNLNFITDLARQRYSQKVIKYIDKINDAQNKEEVSGILKEDKNIQRLLKSFNKENNQKIANSPLVFFKYALSAELLIIAKQLYVLEKTNPTIKTNKANKKPQDSHIAQNADLLSLESSEAKEKMIRFIERKCQFLEEQNDLMNLDQASKGSKIRSSEDTKPKSPPMQKIYENKSKTAVNSSCLQYQTLCENGKLPIYLKDPTTRFFRSKNGISLPQGVTVSEDQYNILHEIDKAISKQHGTKIYARLPTGAGKSHLEKLMNEMFLKVNDNENINEELTPLNKVSPAPAKKNSPAPETNKPNSKKIRSSLSPAPNNTPQSKLPATHEAENTKTAPIQSLININLNISAEELQQINETQDLKRNIVIADEAFFFGRLFLEGKIYYNIDSDINKTDIEQIEKFKDEFIKNLQNKGAIVLVMGASESLNKINHEINRIEGKIFKEEAKIVAQSSSKLIKEANEYFYSNKDSKGREKEPIYQKVIDENVLGKNLKEQIVIVKDRSKQSLLGGNPSKAEFLVRTAFYIKQLSQFLPLELQELNEVKNVIDNLTPKVLGAKSAQSFDNLNLIETLLGSGIFDVNKINSSPNLKSNVKKEYIRLVSRGKGAAIKTTQLENAVKAFFEKTLDDNSFLYNQLPKDQQQERASDGSKLGNLKEKLKVRQYQYRDLEYRRDKLTKDRFDRSEIVETQSSNLEGLEEKKPEDSALFEIVKDNLPRLEAGQKMQYILPDFNINDETCGEKGLGELKGHADIIIIPHFNEEEKKLKCKIAGYSKNYLFDFKECEIDGINLEIKKAKESISLTEKPSIISFFDKKNAIGGDYKDASVNISKQYIQLTKEDCFSNENDLLTWNHLMQFNRDRTDLDSVNLDNLELKFILPESSIIKDDLDCDAKKIIEELLNTNTKKHDKIVLEGYKMYKGITQDPKLRVNFTRGSNYSADLAIDLNDKDLNTSFLEKYPDGEGFDKNNSQFAEEYPESDVLPENEVDITEELYQTNSNNDDFSQSEQTTIEENFISDNDEDSIVELDEELESEEGIKVDINQQKKLSQNFYGNEDGEDEDLEDKDLEYNNVYKTMVLGSSPEAESDEDSSEIGQETEDEKNSNLDQNLRENLGGVFDAEFVEEDKEKFNQKNSESFIGGLTNEIVNEIVENIEVLDSNAEENRKAENEVSLSDSKEQSINDTIILDNYLEEEGENKNKIKEVSIIDDIELGNKMNIDDGLSPIKRSRSNSDDSTHYLDGDLNSNKNDASNSSHIITPLINSNNKDIFSFLSESRSESRTSSRSSRILDLSLLPLGPNLDGSYKETPENSLTNENQTPEKKLHDSNEKKFKIPSPLPTNNSYNGNEESYKTPSPSPNNPELSFDFYEHMIPQEDLISHSMTVNETKYRKKAAEQEQKNLVVLKKLYESEKKGGEPILNNISYMMIKSAVEADLTPQQAIRALEIAKERKGIANGADPSGLPSNFYLPSDEYLFDSYSDFEAGFQVLCFDCGIFSFLEELQGLRLCNIPKDSDEQFSDFVNELENYQESEEAVFPSEIIQDSKNAYEETMKKFKEISNQRRREVEAKEKVDSLSR